MSKEPKPANDLEEMILAQLRKVPGCESVRSIIVQGVLSGAFNWEVYSFDPGTASPEDCHRALAEILPPLQERYSLLID